MTTPTTTKTISPDEVPAVLVEPVPLVHCPIWHQTAENLAESRAGLQSRPLGNATGSRDAP